MISLNEVYSIDTFEFDMTYHTSFITKLLIINRTYLVYKTAINIKNGVVNGNARFVIKLDGFEGEKDELKNVYKEEVLPEIISTPSPNTTEIPPEVTDPDVTDPYPEGLA